MRVLIVGCGYVGLPLGRELACQGHQVFGLRRSERGTAAMRAVGIHPLVADITQPETLTQVPPHYDWVVNTVSASGGGAADYRATYLQGTRNLLEWLGARPPRRLVYTSSTGVYGQTDGSAVDEESPTRPAAETAQILVETEQLLLTAWRETSFPVTILRTAGIYGPGRGYWLKQYLAGEARIEGDGSRILNMIHCDDVVGAIIATLERGRPGEVYNVVDHEPVTQLALFQWLAQARGGPLPPSVSADNTLTRKRGLTSKRVSNAKLLRELSYRFHYPTFRQGLAGLGD